MEAPRERARGRGGQGVHLGRSIELPPERLRHHTRSGTPAGLRGDIALVGYAEEILENGTGLGVGLIRTITPLSDGIRVEATVTSPAGDLNDPANGNSVFQARYTVRWLPRLIPVDPRSLQPAEVIELPPQPAGSTTSFELVVRNRGPDDLEIASCSVDDDAAGAFRFLPFGASVPAPAGGTARLPGTFAPPQEGEFSATAVLRSNDPAHAELRVPLRGPTSLAASGRLRLRVDPYPVPLGLQRRAVTVYAEDERSGVPVTGTVQMTSAAGGVSDVGITNVPFTYIFSPERIVSIDSDEGGRTFEWTYPSGMIVNLPSPYTEIPIDFGFPA
jgi:hypothetical protein